MSLFQRLGKLTLRRRVRPLYGVSINDYTRGPAITIEQPGNIFWTKNNNNKEQFGERSALMARIIGMNIYLDYNWDVRSRVSKFRHRFIYTTNGMFEIINLTFIKARGRQLWFGGDYQPAQRQIVKKMFILSGSPRMSTVKQFAKNPYIDPIADISWVPKHNWLFPRFFADNPYI